MAVVRGAGIGVSDFLKSLQGFFPMSSRREVLQTEFPEYAGIQFHTADDHFKAAGSFLCASLVRKQHIL